jgi:FemAB-related protein (PEP-CTERM system-associated)
MDGYVYKSTNAQWRHQIEFRAAPSTSPTQGRIVVTEVTVSELNEIARPRWDAFVHACPDGTFFHLSGWAGVIKAEMGCTNHYLYAERAGAIVAVLPLSRVHNLIAGDVLISTPFLVYGGPIGDPDAIDALVHEARRLAENLGVDYLELRNRRPLDGDWETKSLYVTFRKPLEPDLDANLQAIPRKQRAMVRKGMKAGTNVVWDLDLDTFYSVFSESYRNLGTPVFGKSLFSRLLAAFQDQVWVTTVRKDKQPLSSVVSFIFRDEVLPYYGGSIAAARDFAANDFLYWAVMERAVGCGLKTFDYGRSKVGTGSYDFKKHWGFEPEPLAYQYHLVRSQELPNLSPTNPKFQLPIQLWKRLPVGVTRIVGPPIARRLA